MYRYTCISVLVCGIHVCMSNVCMLQDAMISLNEELQTSQGTIVGLKSSMNEVHNYSVCSYDVNIGIIFNFQGSPYNE